MMFILLAYAQQMTMEQLNRMFVTIRGTCGPKYQLSDELIDGEIHSKLVKLS
jgi:hypothetical protein